MKILIDARMYGLENTGIGRYTMNLVKELTKIDSKNNYVILLRKNYFDQLNFPSNWKKVLADFKHYTLAEQIKLPFIIRKENPDITHFPHFNVPVFYYGSYVVTIHDLLMHYQKGVEATTLSPIKYFVKRLGYKCIFDRAVNKSQKILVPSEYVKKDLLKNYALKSQKIVVTYEGADKPQAVKNSAEVLEKYNLDAPYFFYVGNAYPHKNLPVAIEAVVLLNKKLGKKIYFAIAGARNIFKKKLEKIVQEFDAQKYVKLLGFVPEGEIGTLYQSSLAFVFPSLSEGFGLPGIEAMLAKTLCLSSKIPVLEEVFKDAAIFFDPKEVDSIERAMEKVLDLSSQEREKLIKDGFEFASRYSWRKMAKETLEIYESCTSL